MKPNAYLGLMARFTLSVLLLAGLPLLSQAEETAARDTTAAAADTKATPEPDAQSRKRVHNGLLSETEIKNDVEDFRNPEAIARYRQRAVSCVRTCEDDRNSCAGKRDLQTCLSEERLCLGICDPASMAMETRHARAHNALYKDRPDLLLMRLEHEGRNIGALCRQRCDDSARTCVENSLNAVVPCHEGRNQCLARCPTLATAE